MRFARRRRRAIPFVQQMEAADCGAACLAMALTHHGRDVTLREVREAVGSGRGGVTALAIAEAARRFGLRARGVRLEPAGLRYLPAGTLLHWGFDHFVVLERVTGKGVRIVDPAMGRRLVPHARVAVELTGVAVVLEPGETFATGGGHPRRLRDYLEKCLDQKGVLARVLAMSVLLQVVGLSLPLLTGLVVDHVVPEHDVNLLAVVCLGLLLVFAFQFFATVLRSYLLLYSGTVLNTRFSLGFMDHLVRLPCAFFLERQTGDLTLRYHSNRILWETLTSGLLSTLFDGTLVSLYLVLILLVSPLIGALVVILGALQVGVLVAIRRRQRELTSRTLEMQSKSQSQLVDLLEGMETLKALGAEQRAVERWTHRFVDELNVVLEQGRMMSWVGGIRTALAAVSSLAILGTGAYLAIAGDLSLGTMLTLSALAGGFLGPLNGLVNTAMSLQQLRSHMERIEDVMGTPREQDPQRVVAAGTLRGAIDLERVSFRYGPNAAWVLKDVSLQIQPGHKVAIVGGSGAGKSTLARLILGLYAPGSGRILFDGKDLATLDLHSVRAQLGVVTQSAHVFGTTVRANIALTDPATILDNVIEAAKLAEIHDDILRMPLGYDTPLLNGAAALSGGQRQRLALARALVHRPPILLLDEATNHLDAPTEGRVTANLARLQCTQIVIAHRLSTVADADTILVLAHGQLVEVGTHSELLSRDGAYSCLVAAQDTPGLLVRFPSRQL